MMEEMYGLLTAGNYHEQPPSTVAAVRDTYHQPVDQSPEFRGHREIPAVIGSGQSTLSASVQKSSSSNTINHNITGSAEELEERLSSINRSKIMSHPLYPKLLQAYIACQKVGAPPDIANHFDDIFKEKYLCRRSAAGSFFGDDPELDEFMETYCEVLNKYRSDLATPFDEATTFLNNMQTQLANLCNGTSSRIFQPDEAQEEDLSTGEVEVQESNWTSEDRELKNRLLRKYSKYISSLKHEFSNKKKKGKLPKEARQVLLDWWNVHYKWPYPTEADKIGLAVSTGLDQKQINNWFINQRKRHWKPSENMQFAVMDSLCGSFYVNN